MSEALTGGDGLTRGLAGNQARPKRESLRLPGRSKSHKEISSREVCESRRLSSGFPRKAGATQYQKRGTLGNSCPNLRVAAPRNRTLPPDRRARRAGSRFSFHVAKFFLGGLPIHKRFLAGFHGLNAFAQNIAMPGGRLKLRFIAAEVGPQFLHSAELFLPGHSVQWQRGLHT